MNDLIDRLFSQTFQIRLAIYAGVLLLLSALYYNFVYSPAALVVNEKTTRVEDLRAQREKKTRMANQLERLREVAARHDTTPGAIATAWTLRSSAVTGLPSCHLRPERSLVV